eukprot:TRINITY_DN860_c0_g1_i2.p1 TRINITY_DN860_c0_g1~~TRINITY_DN860_c0_g1_i2.p1  ORF type:complete len:608 (+),score=109.46 TRINITY_DN860_c0_g1_i2:103-1926(+)
MTTLQFDMSGLLDRTLSKVHSGSFKEKEKCLTRSRSGGQNLPSRQVTSDTEEKYLGDEAVENTMAEESSFESNNKKKLKRAKSFSALRMVVSALKNAISDNAEQDDEKQCDDDDNKNDYDDNDVQNLDAGRQLKEITSFALDKISGLPADDEDTEDELDHDSHEVSEESLDVELEFVDEETVDASVVLNDFIPKSQEGIIFTEEESQQTFQALKRTSDNPFLQYLNRISGIKEDNDDQYVSNNNNESQEDNDVDKTAVDTDSQKVVVHFNFIDEDDDNVNTDNNKDQQDGVVLTININNYFDNQDDVIESDEAESSLQAQFSADNSIQIETIQQVEPVPPKFGTFNFLENRWVTPKERESNEVEKLSQKHLVRLQFATFNFLENRWVRAEERQVTIGGETEEVEEQGAQGGIEEEQQDDEEHTLMYGEVVPLLPNQDNKIQVTKPKRLKFVTFNFLENRWVRPNETIVIDNEEILLNSPSSKLTKLQNLKKEIVDNIRKLPKQEFLTFNFLQNKWVKRPRSFRSQGDFDIKQITDSQTVQQKPEESKQLLRTYSDSDFDEAMELDFIVVDQELLLTLQDERTVYCFKWGGFRKKKQSRRTLLKNIGI